MGKFKLLYQIILGYCIATAAVYFLSDRSIFLPPSSTYKDSSKIIKLKTADGATIAGIYLHNPNAEFTILYSHGNAYDLGMFYPYLLEMQAWGFSIFSYDYRGYGISEGKPSEKATYQDIDAAYEYLVQEQKIDPKKIILFGRSLGSGPTIELATHKPVGAIILEAPFVSIYRVVTYYPVFLFDKYNNLAKINHINVPILFIHGDQDKTVPLWHGQKLYDTFQGQKEFLLIPGAGHNNIDAVDPQKYKVTIQKFAKQVDEET